MQSGRAALTVYGKRLAQRAMLPAVRRPLCFAMGEERVNHAYLFAFPRHYVDRVVKQRVADGGRCFRHENAGLRLLPHQHRERPNVIEMRMGKEDAIDRATRQRREVWQCRFPLVLRMHAAIQYDSVVTPA